MDAFTTEVGGEAYLRHKGIIAMASITGGEVRGTVLSPGQRSPTVIGKLGVDRQVRENLRVRLTGSMHHTNRSLSNTLYGGDRAGSRYYYALENTAATEWAQFTSGAINPGFRNEVTAFQINPFVKSGGLEVFGVIERAEGKTSAEAIERRFNQQAVDMVYRAVGDYVYLAARYNRVKGRLANFANDIEADRWQIGGGIFLMNGLMMKLEYVNQEFKGYPAKKVHLLLDVRREADAIRFVDRCARSFDSYRGSWRVEPKGRGTIITYELTARPSFEVPGFILKRLLKRDSGEMIGNLRREFAARAGAGGPVRAAAGSERLRSRSLQTTRRKDAWLKYL